MSPMFKLSHRCFYIHHEHRRRKQRLELDRVWYLISLLVTERIINLNHFRPWHLHVRTLVITVSQMTLSIG